jgi:hypothetical protein
VPKKKAKLPLSKTHPELAGEADGWDASQFTYGSNKKKEWLCVLGHQWKEKISNRAMKKYGCPICSGQQILPGYNDLATLRPEIANEAYGWNPQLVSLHSNQKLDWECKEGHRWSATINNRTSRGDACSVCSSHQTLSGFNDLATTDPEIANQAFNWDPTTASRASNKKKVWRCRLGHFWDAPPSSRTSGSGCPTCAGKITLKGFNDLETVSSQLAKEAYGWDPSTVTVSSNKSFLWKCEEGHVWRATVNNRSAGKGCPTCANSGFDPNNEGYLYFIAHQDWEMYQIGITNSPDDRVKKHRRIGWEVLEVRGPMDGLLTQQWETAILRMLKAKGADLSNSTVAGKFEGYSEAWSKSTFPVKSIKELMRLTEEFEEKE